MAKFTKGKYRKFDGYLRQRVSKRNMQGLRINDGFEEELWGLLDYFSEVREVGEDFLKRKYSGRSLEKAYLGFRSLCRQAKIYYQTAQKTNYRSSALLYYYSFLNLAKAYLIANGDDYSGKRINHGLSSTLGVNNSLEREFVSTKNGVFPEFYKKLFDRSLPNKTRFNIHKLLGYCLDISYQYRLFGPGEQKVTFGYYLSCVSKKDKTKWNLLAINHGKVIETYPKTFEMVLDAYESVEMSELDFRNMFDLQKKDMDSFLVIQSKTPTSWITDNIPDLRGAMLSLLKDFDGHIESNLHSDDHDFYVTTPYTKSNQLLLNEAMAIYMVMYYLSELVRYNTFRLDKFFDKKESWVIESFIKSSPSTFLKSMVANITGTNFVLERR